MAMNPMQRRARNSFLIGFLIALIIMAVVVMFLIKKINGLNANIAALEKLQKSYLVASTDLESGQEVTLDGNFTSTKVQTNVDPSTVISSDDFEFKDKNGNSVIKYNEDGSKQEKKLIMKINVPAGTIVTKDMVKEYDDNTTNTDRIREFSMISLPSQLKNGDYIDIRLSIPNGQDYIVLTKKKILGTTATTVWLKLNELELELMNSAIVENYTMTGSRLYAIEYVEPGMQESSIPTYVASQNVITLMKNNPNIAEEIFFKYNDAVIDNAALRVENIQPEIDKNIDNQSSLVSSGNASEDESLKAARQTYVDSLEGTESVGYTEDKQ